MKELYEIPIQKEKEGLQEQYEILESTDGFLSLTDKQQKLLKASLYLQERAERSGDRASEQAIVSKEQGYVTDKTEILNEEYLKEVHDLEPDFYLDPEKRKYRNSQNRVANDYCHGSINSLENEESKITKPEELPDNFFEADYQKVEKIDDARDLIIKSGFPSIVHISDDKNNLKDGLHQKHSFLALGESKDGDIVLWEKEGFNLPFRIVALSEMYKNYNSESYWGVRKLSSNEVDSEK